MSILEFAANRQAIWSATANSLKSRIDLARKASFFLSIVGALVASLASMQASDGIVRTILISVGAVALAITGIIGSQILTSEGIRQQIRARAASEALKREAYLYATAAGEYSDAGTRNDKLKAALEAIESQITDLALVQQSAPGAAPSLRSDLSFADYLEERVKGQIAYHGKRSREYSRASKLLHAVEFALAFVAAILTALAGVIGKGPFDIAAVIGVLTTCAAAVVAHLQASHYDDLIVSYRAAGSKLEYLKDTTDEKTTSVAALANAAEEILAAETNSWQAMWSNKSK
ncbi:DUF4231 domain-containing protein [Rhizobium sp. WYCCWR 11290]|uniref:DUF4231 domain-containing protein n=1 Tax=Rhizobium changzhiense TaxID=2692317 RepID=A0A7Z0ZWE3_9HYPH|nr:DUF4231 domain-containing protein [Rhizobium changzhiense]NZD66262.1 DUF4231 domain-containing protein [Rhizobium changzhiense]